jgi:hypothetical protein
LPRSAQAQDAVVVERFEGPEDAVLHPSGFEPAP